MNNCKPLDRYWPFASKRCFLLADNSVITIVGEGPNGFRLSDGTDIPALPVGEEFDCDNAAYLVNPPDDTELLAKLDSIITAVNAVGNNTDTLEALQAGTTAAIAAQTQYIDQVEQLLSTLGNNTDGLETLLTQLGLNTDQVETKLDEVKAALLAVQGANCHGETANRVYDACVAEQLTAVLAAINAVRTAVENKPVYDYTAVLAEINNKLTTLATLKTQLDTANSLASSVVTNTANISATANSLLTVAQTTDTDIKELNDKVAVLENTLQQIKILIEAGNTSTTDVIAALAETNSLLAQIQAVAGGINANTIELGTKLDVLINSNLRQEATLTVIRQDMDELLILVRHMKDTLDNIAAQLVDIQAVLQNEFDQTQMLLSQQIAQFASVTTTCTTTAPTVTATAVTVNIDGTESLCQTLSVDTDAKMSWNADGTLDDSWSELGYPTVTGAANEGLTNAFGSDGVYRMVYKVSATYSDAMIDTASSNIAARAYGSNSPDATTNAPSYNVPWVSVPNSDQTNKTTTGPIAIGSSKDGTTAYPYLVLEIKPAVAGTGAMAYDGMHRPSFMLPGYCSSSYNGGGSTPTTPATTTETALRVVKAACEREYEQSQTTQIVNAIAAAAPAPSTNYTPQLTQLMAYTDQLEGNVSAVNTTLTTTNAKLDTLNTTEQAVKTSTDAVKASTDAVATAIAQLKATNTTENNALATALASIDAKLTPIRRSLQVGALNVASGTYAGAGNYGTQNTVTIATNTNWAVQSFTVTVLKSGTKPLGADAVKVTLDNGDTFLVAGMSMTFSVAQDQFNRAEMLNTAVITCLGNSACVVNYIREGI